MKAKVGSQVVVDEPSQMQACHGEADTLIAFHDAKTQSCSTLIRASDTEVQVIFISLAGRIDNLSLIMDYGLVNHHRYINISLTLNKRPQ